MNKLLNLRKALGIDEKQPVGTLDEIAIRLFDKRHESKNLRKAARFALKRANHYRRFWKLLALSTPHYDYDEEYEKLVEIPYRDGDQDGTKQTAG